MKQHDELITAPNLDAADDFYEALLAAHEGLGTEESHAFNARLVLVLANHIGSTAVLKRALAAARQTAPGDTPGT
ncbi:hypothetical protein H4CHR_05733 [Variovorax sp. PBS-H4]|uniref:DUF2783 domain-containing protein n=1 Tax=Variovorax sp. PBS-H4 TaxID=434008 RepID=UPI00131936F7|nr:DUF2783 domain-containing protein [Variovorax sp. PBS-H4]VTU40999.1 hypothetical protein H4CHR_05733 [Variovorax sp. PBS-H4]